VNPKRAPRVQDRTEQRSGTDAYGHYRHSGTRSTNSDSAA
jgi:hypothetical protein